MKTNNSQLVRAAIVLAAVIGSPCYAQPQPFSLQPCSSGRTGTVVAVSESKSLLRPGVVRVTAIENSPVRTKESFLVSDTVATQAGIKVGAEICLQDNTNTPKM
jgi:hypothetical protein